MSLFGRRSGRFGFSRNVGNALANPSYLNALGTSAMLAGFLPQRKEALDQENKMMKIVDSGDPQAIINYSLQQARATNDPELLSAVRAAQSRLTTQTKQQKVASLLTRYADPNISDSARSGALSSARKLQADPLTGMSLSQFNGLISSAETQYSRAFANMAENAYASGEGSEAQNNFIALHGTRATSALRSIQAGEQRDQNVIDQAGNEVKRRTDEDTLESLLTRFANLSGNVESYEDNKPELLSIEKDLIALGEESQFVDSSVYVGLVQQTGTELYKNRRASDKAKREADDFRQDQVIDGLVERFLKNAENFNPSQFMQIVRAENQGNYDLDQSHLATLNDRLKDADEERQSGVSLFTEGKLTDSRQDWLDNNPTFDLTRFLEKTGGSEITKSFGETLKEYQDPKTSQRKKIQLGRFISEAIDLAKDEQEKVRRSDEYRSTTIESTFSDYLDMGDPEKLGYQPGRALSNQVTVAGFDFGSPAMYDIVRQMRDATAGRLADDYKKLEKQLDLQLQMNPDAANDPEVFIGNAFKELKFFEKYVSGQDVVNERDEDLENVRAQIEIEKEAIVSEHNRQFPDNKISTEDVTEQVAYLSIQEQSARRLAQEQADVAANIRRVREMVRGSRGENLLRRPTRSEYFAENPSERTAGVETAVTTAVAPIIGLGKIPGMLTGRNEQRESE